jgi:hypothetical protein
MYKLRNLLVGIALILGVFSGSAGVALINTSDAQALSPPEGCNAYFLTFPAWYNGLVGMNGGSCTVVSPTDLKTSEDDTQYLSRFIWIIVLNALQILLQVVAYLAVGFITYGGFVYLTSAGRSDKITRGREMIQNAVIGLVISLVAVTLVAYVGGMIKAGG